MNIFSAIRLPDLLSLLNALLGFASITAAYIGRSDICVPLLIIAATADGLDGFLARKFGSGPLGTNLDSLADLVSFGVAPAVFVSIAFGFHSLAIAVWIVGVFYLVCGMLRLARFDVSPKNDRLFEGLPIPPCGIAVASSVLIGSPKFTLALMIVLSALMVSNIPYPKVRSLHAIVSLVLVFLIMVFAICVAMGRYYAAVLPYSIITTMIVYMASPVVMPFLQKER